MPLATPLLVGCTLSLILTVCSSRVSAQAQSARVVHVTVTDPLNRFVTGIEQERFQIVEKGVRRPITGFSDANSPVTVAIVSGLWLITEESV
jgi:hypothetical protein